MNLWWGSLLLAASCSLQSQWEGEELSAGLICILDQPFDAKHQVQKQDSVSEGFLRMRMLGLGSLEFRTVSYWHGWRPLGNHWRPSSHLARFADERFVWDSVWNFVRAYLQKINRFFQDALLTSWVLPHAPTRPSAIYLLWSTLLCCDRSSSFLTEQRNLRRLH
jgi:hypothetical protein